ncbi:putative cholinesterase [Aspergillus clavatus NRRL 1]|uniref:Cholinesterase, putative n=1 Tax=Aspergillus clavatus (strain ATCC 1007 / CBS 513.65 / DSM 816 / NCTC 3887 / NRRL 1 / QM 1276 / 107) TaxID=344612 RepID=A1CG70_ASPCL|nr:cholinesterase, putative [Aspergillus clavatus NRRL 1]EAW10950.1 cholinesterase, putative [Aspergillus clavatus NRRL 1]
MASGSPHGLNLISDMFSQLVLSLLFSIPALAAPAPASPGGCKAPGGPPDISSLSTLQALKYNDLGAQNNGTAAVLVHDRVTYGQAQALCSAIGETLYPLHDAPENNRTELQYQFNYLVYNHDLRGTDQVWVAQASSQDCSAYSLSRKAIVDVPCHLRLPALCTSTVPPTTDTTREVVESSKISVGWDGYTWTGSRDARSFRFVGVPFANPPVDDLRFAPPQPYSGPKKLDATTFSASCIQTISAYGTLGGRGISEDCLYLNIYTPVLPAAAHKNPARKPVAVYFYGGAFIQGSASMIDYDGGNFASRNDVVVVTVNYRVGALGWLATGNLTTGSYGTRDQILALEWVNTYIEAFGGDKSRITIFGQSAGGQSVVALLSSTAARGLFSAAIVQSAPLDLPWFTRSVYRDLVTPEIAKAVGCGQGNRTTSETQLLACLRSVPASAFFDNTTEFQAALSASTQKVAASFLHSSPMLASIEPLMPMVDDAGSGVIDDQFHLLLATDSLPNRVPTLFTTVTDEGGLFVGRFVPELAPTQANLNLLLGLSYPPGLAKALAASGAFPLDASDPDTVRITGIHALTSSEWTCPQAHLLALASNASSSSARVPNKPFPALYALQIANGHIQSPTSAPAICSPNPVYNATCHSADVLPVWGTLDAKTRAVAPYYSPADHLLSQLLADVFAAFFRARSPNPSVHMLARRGPAYAHSRAVFEHYHIAEYDAADADAEVAVLGYEPGWVRNPGGGEQCRVFGEFGYTFERAG